MGGRVCRNYTQYTAFIFSVLVTQTDPCCVVHGKIVFCNMIEQTKVQEKQKQKQKKRKYIEIAVILEEGA